MTTKNKRLRRFAAGVGAAALALAGVVGAGTVASAEPTADPEPTPVTSNIDPNAEGSIIIHKHVEAEGSTPGNPHGAALEGVTFRVTEILLDESSVPLATAEGWNAIDGLVPGDIPDGDFTLGAWQDVKTLANGQATAGGLNVGLYLVEEIDSGPNLITTPAAPFLVAIPMPGDGDWNYDVDVYPKNVLGDVTATKTVGTPDTPADVELGAIVPFTIEATVPKPALPYTSFSITDELSAGLDFVSWGAISIGDTALEAEDYTISADNTVVTLTDSGLAKLNAAADSETGTSVTAVINAEVTDLGKLENKATVTINGTPGDTPEVTTNWARLDVKKSETGTEKYLAGATFELYDADKSVLLATGTTDADGDLSFIVWVGNDEDTSEVVYLKETVAPEGYVLPADPWTDAITLKAGETAEGSITLQPIGNYKPEGPDLPLTGAQGTMALTLGGLLLVGAGAGALVVSRRRNEA